MEKTTAMQILKENISKSDLLSSPTKMAIVAFIENLEETEKTQIVDAFVEGKKTGMNCGGSGKLTTGKTYYTQTYKQ